MNRVTGAVTPHGRKIARLRALALCGLFMATPIQAVYAETNAADTIVRHYGTPTDLPFTLSGSYLSGRLAGISQDFAQAAAFFEETLAADPSNTMLLERTFLLKLANGDVMQAVHYAGELERVGLDNFLAHLAKAGSAMINGSYDEASTVLDHPGNGPLAQLSLHISRAWALYGAGKVEEAIAAIDSLQGPEWFDVFKETHKAHLLFAAGRKQDALTAIEAAYAIDQGAIRVVDTFARLLAVNEQPAEAVKVLDQFDLQFHGHPQIGHTRQIIEKGGTIPPMVADPSAGMSEILYGLGAIIGRDGAEELSTAYLQLALFLDPTAEFAAMALGNVYDRMGQPDRAIDALSRIPDGGVLKREAEIQVGLAYNTLERIDDARAHLGKLIELDPSDLEAVTALGNVLRSHKLYEEAEATYSKGMDTIPTLEEQHWLLLYFRGICRERMGKWEMAEADFRRALELNKDQPLVLNYLGYSLVDQGLKLDEALGMIRKAVDLRPTDGYIVDSLGWVYYRLGRYEEAARELERAIELRPADPVINDHLGDAYWMIGRRNEARFQWNHARDLGPEPEELPKILDKISNGLTAPVVKDEAKADAGKNGG